MSRPGGGHVQVEDEAQYAEDASGDIVPQYQTEEEGDAAPVNLQSEVSQYDQLHKPAHHHGKPEVTQPTPHRPRYDVAGGMKRPPQKSGPHAV